MYKKLKFSKLCMQLTSVVFTACKVRDSLKGKCRVGNEK